MLTIERYAQVKACSRDDVWQLVREGNLMAYLDGETLCVTEEPLHGAVSAYGQRMVDASQVEKLAKSFEQLRAQQQEAWARVEKQFSTRATDAQAVIQAKDYLIQVKTEELKAARRTIDDLKHELQVLSQQCEDLRMLNASLQGL